MMIRILARICDQEGWGYLLVKYFVSDLNLQANPYLVPWEDEPRCKGQRYFGLRERRGETHPAVISPCRQPGIELDHGDESHQRRPLVQQYCRTAR